MPAAAECANKPCAVLKRECIVSHSTRALASSTVPLFIAICALVVWLALA